MRRDQATWLVLALSTTLPGCQAIEWRSLSLFTPSPYAATPRHLISSNPRRRLPKRWSPWPSIPRFSRSERERAHSPHGTEGVLVSTGEFQPIRRDNASQVASSSANMTAQAQADPWDSWDDPEEGMECSWVTCEEGEPGCLEFDETNDPLEPTSWVQAPAVVEDTEAYLAAGGVMWGLWLGPNGLFLDSKPPGQGEAGTVTNDLDEFDSAGAVQAAADGGSGTDDSGPDDHSASGDGDGSDGSGGDNSGDDNTGEDNSGDDSSGNDSSGDDSSSDSPGEDASSDTQRRGWKGHGKDNGDDGDDGNDAYSGKAGDDYSSDFKWDNGHSGKGDDGDEQYDDSGRGHSAYASGKDAHDGYSSGKGKGGAGGLAYDSHTKASTQGASSHGSSQVHSSSAGSSGDSNDCGALAQLYHSLGGASWTQATGWGSGNCCGWYGITCMSGRVQKISLAKNGLTGSMPSALFSLKGLVSIDVSGNDIDLGVGDQYDSLTHLAHFAAPNCSLTGAIPPSLLASDSLVRLDLSGNRLTGTVIITGGSLQMVDLAQNALTGITSSNKANALTRLYLGDNQIRGQLPVLPSSLQYLDTSNNQTGSIPSLSTYANLQHLDLRSNQLTGPLPDLSGLPHLTSLYLGNNSLSGPLGAAPPSLTSCSILPNNFDACQQGQQNGTVAATCHVQCHASEPIAAQGIPVQALAGEKLQPSVSQASLSGKISPQGGSYGPGISDGNGVPGQLNAVDQKSGGVAEQVAPIATALSPAQAGAQSGTAQTPQMGPQPVTLRKPGGVVMTGTGRSTKPNGAAQMILLLPIAFMLDAV